MTACKMSSKTALFVWCVLAMVAMAQCQQPPRQQQHPSEMERSNVRYKRMYVMCPPNFNRIGNECYYISPNKRNWLDAYFDCKDHNSKLAEPMKYEDKHLRRYLQKNNLGTDLWIGGTYNWKSNKWQWGHNGREMEYQSFSQMVPGSSRDLKFNCALLRAELKYRWSAEECTKKMNFICQHRMPMVSEMSRNQIYSRWNETYPNQKANEKIVYVVHNPNEGSDASRDKVYNSMKQVLAANPSIQPYRPGYQRRKTTRGRRLPTAPPTESSNRSNYISPDVVNRRNQISQYAPDAQNDINSIDNGHHQHRNGGHSPARFNIDFGTRNSGTRRNPSFPPRKQYRPQQVESRQPETPQPYQRPHQHRHQSSGGYSGPSRKPTKQMQQQASSYYNPMKLYTPPAPTMTTTTTTTTTTTPAPTSTSTRWPATAPTAATEEPSRKHFHRPSATPTKRLISAMSEEEKRLHREQLRKRLSQLSPEEQEFFLQKRAQRIRQKEEQRKQRLREKQHQLNNEVVTE